MPLKKGSSRAVISENIHEMVAAGHPVKQAVAASLRNAHYQRKHDPNAGSHDAGHPSHARVHREAMRKAMKRIGHPGASHYAKSMDSDSDYDAGGDTDNDND